MARPRTTLGYISQLLLFATLSGCGGGGESNSTPTTAASPAAPTPTPPSGPPAAPATDCAVPTTLTNASTTTLAANSSFGKAFGESRFEVTNFFSGMQIRAHNIRLDSRFCYTASYQLANGTCTTSTPACGANNGDDLHSTFNFNSVPASQVTRFFLRLYPAVPGARIQADLCIRTSSVDCDQENVVLHGRVLGANGLGLEGATVRAIANNFSYAISTSSDGSYDLRVPKQPLPDEFIYSAYKSTAPTYVPRSLFGYKLAGSYFSEEIQLQPLTDQYAVVEIEPTVHHLGDDSFGGSVNSQFQRSAEGTTFSRTFQVQPASLNYSTSTLSLQVKGSQCTGRNAILLNGTAIGALPNSPSDGSYSEVTSSSTPRTYLVAGTNTVTVRTSNSCPGAPATDYDDIEFENIILTFR